MKKYEDTNVHCLYSLHDKVWTNEIESKMWNWTWTFYFVSNNRIQITISKYNEFSGFLYNYSFVFSSNSEQNILANYALFHIAGFSKNE